MKRQKTEALQLLKSSQTGGHGMFTNRPEVAILSMMFKISGQLAELNNRIDLVVGKPKPKTKKKK